MARRAAGIPLTGLGDLGQTHRTDELGQLATAFNGLVARLRAALQTQLTAELTPLQLLVGEAPAGVHAGVWAAVRLAAFNALWRAREFYRRAMEPGEAEQPVNAPDVTERGRHMAVQYFWADLEEFVEEQPPPPRWRRQVGAAHPFTFLQHPAAQLRVRRT
jgi:hypothetical protein